MSGIVGQNLGRASGLIKSGGVGADAVDSANIADDAIDSEHYTDGSIDNAHLADDAVGLAEMASGTDGQIITYDASGNPTAVGPGSDGQVLTSTGAGSPPAFESAAGGVISTPYAARLQEAASITPSNATYTKFDFSSGVEVYDKGGIANIATSRITVPADGAGFWVFGTHTRKNSASDAARNIMTLYKNGTTIGGNTYGDEYEMWGGEGDMASSYQGWGGEWQLDLAADDYIEVYVYGNSNNNDYLQYSFYGWFLGASS